MFSRFCEQINLDLTPTGTLIAVIIQFKDIKLITLVRKLSIRSASSGQGSSFHSDTLEKRVTS